MCTSRWYKKNFFSQKKSSPFHHFFLLLPSPFPPKSPIFPISPTLLALYSKIFSGLRPEHNLPPTHPSIFVGLRPSASGLHRRAPCRFVDSGKRGKGEEEGGKREKREGESLLFTAPSQPKPASGPSKSGARSAPTPPTTYI